MSAVTSNLPQRDAFWTRVYEIARQDRDVIIISADMGAPALDKIRLDLPNQFINAGIAEQNAIVVGSGLAMAGKKVFAYAIAPFITLRCLEQVRVNNCMMKIPLTLVGVGAGFGYQDSGPTHHMLEDIAVMRAFPTIEIDSVSDSVMAADVAERSIKERRINYVRLDRQTLPDLYKTGHDFRPGLDVLRPGKDIMLVGTGIMTHAALETAEILSKKGIDAGVVDLYRLPVNAPALLNAVKGAKKVATLEEHFLPGGMGSAVAEVLADAGSTLPLKRLGLPVEKGYCYTYGGRDALHNWYGIGAEQIIDSLIGFAKG
ncbi:1-deoxy-D-xylulose-5-phosphate synthase [Paramagnetospirillum caucaseum]|uniref:1-deoxy-D-xylulose-5-phosphate synthase n=1 Tax=Paramagnetospirillum caucaseum TaxID=1244869 RepID=M3AG70_9PROT|nr:transketolase C-terminal domain-containing protein [Paramagnetospirillum caucaseum]EME71559.1 1-deoxy-D-xylulose-5-phosphate synthase [Paramagnetospirillum caucaseum]